MKLRRTSVGGCTTRSGATAPRPAGEASLPSLDGDELQRFFVGNDSGELPVALAGQDGFERGTTGVLRSPYEARPRTKIYENINVHSSTWYGIIVPQLRRAAGCRVLCSIYESNVGDDSIGKHIDKLFGLIVQLQGSKLWTIYSADGEERQRILTQSGDILLIPQDVAHAVEHLATPLTSRSRSSRTNLTRGEESYAPALKEPLSDLSLSWPSTQGWLQFMNLSKYPPH